MKNNPLRELARSEYAQNMYRASKEINGISLFENSKDLSRLQIEDIQEKVAPIPTESKEIISNYEQQVKDLVQKQSEISIRLSELLEYSVENEILEFSNLYLIYNVLEKLEDDKWIKCFKTYEDFLATENETLILEATYNLSMLVFKAKI